MNDAKAKTTSCCCCCSSGKTNDSQNCRRGFLAVLLGIIALAPPLLVGIVAYLNPWRQKGQAGQFFRIASLDALPDDGTPRKFPVITDRRDAWTLFPNEAIGSVFLRRVPGDAPAAEKADAKAKSGPGPGLSVQALCVICPHAGCFISYDEKSKNFLCPCHTAHFDLTGKRTDDNSPSPRDMDMLDEVEIRNGNEIWVKFLDFRTGSSAKVAKS